MDIEVRAQVRWMGFVVAMKYLAKQHKDFFFSVLTAYLGSFIASEKA